MDVSIRIGSFPDRIRRGPRYYFIVVLDEIGGLVFHGSEIQGHRQLADHLGLEHRIVLGGGQMWVDRDGLILGLNSATFDGVPRYILQPLVLQISSLEQVWCSCIDIQTKTTREDERRFRKFLGTAA